ncbi:hypothetical protein NA57DRAFT_56120 [Rhizodiscina lignyota]|uniref:C2H2-type domain-containing protein n=1 Tax=Rhizodiscina lignyota TaxID=1504668 RepID=A0A9P4IFZ8_9PEZI|nr:hypothetical protein NA57DRAFT_56120 [Rhizodiscina lignyota]
MPYVDELALCLGLMLIRVQPPQNDALGNTVLVPGFLPHPVKSIALQAQRNHHFAAQGTESSLGAGGSLRLVPDELQSVQTAPMNESTCDCVYSYGSHLPLCPNGQSSFHQDGNNFDADEFDAGVGPSLDGTTCVDGYDDVLLDPALRNSWTFNDPGVDEDLPYSALQLNSTIEAHIASVGHLFTRHLNDSLEPPSQKSHTTILHDESETEGLRCDNFIDDRAFFDTIFLSGRSEVCRDLQLLVEKGFRQQETSADQPLCDLHALQTSLKSRLAEYNIKAATVSQLNNIRQSQRFRSLCDDRPNSSADAHPYGDVVGDLQSLNGLSATQLAIILLIYSEKIHEKIHRPLQLGICTVNRLATDSDVPFCTLEIVNAHPDGNALTIWLINDNVEGVPQDEYGDMTLNHWSGIAPDRIPRRGQKEAKTTAPTKPASAQKPSKARIEKAGRAVSDANTPDLTESARQPPSLKCTVPGCKRREPFKTPRDLRRHRDTVHINESDRPVACTVAHCKRRFHWNKDMNRHVQDVHVRSHPLRCLVKGCPKYGQEMRNCKRHYANMHPGVAPPTPLEA